MFGQRLSSFSINAALVLAALTLGHELIYLLAHGPGDGYVRAMAEGGHDRYWTTFVITILLVSGVLGAIVVAQFRRLRRLASTIQVEFERLDDRGLPTFRSFVRPLWWRVAAGAVTAYLVQENLEAAVAGTRLPGLGVLAGEHADALPVLVVVSMVVAVVGALVGWRRQILLARIRAAGCRARRMAARVLRPAVLADLPASSEGQRQVRVRAPPLLALRPA